MAAPRQTRSYIALLLVVSFWGSYPAAIKLALVDMSPFVLSALRSTLASLFLGIVVLRREARELRRLTAADVGAFAFLGFVGIVVATTFTYVAVSLTTASNAAILQAATPVMVAVGARLYLGERLGRVQWLGVACSAAGVLLVVSRGEWAALRPSSLQVGDLLVLFSLSGWSAYTIYGKRVLAGRSPALATAAAYLLGTLMVIPLAPLTAPLYPPPRFASLAGWGVIFYQGIPGALAHVWWYEGVRAVGPSRSAIFMNLQPVVGVLLAAALLGERIGLAQLLGGVAVLVGVGLTTGQRDKAGG